MVRSSSLSDLPTLYSRYSITNLSAFQQLRGEISVQSELSAGHNFLGVHEVVCEELLHS